MTDRSRKGSARVTSWLAGWIDYAFAIVLAAGRLLRVPRASAAGAAPSPAQHWLVRPAEVAMLTLSFFLTAHLISGGTDSVVAPQINPFSMLSTSASADELPPTMATSVARDLTGATVLVVVGTPSAGPSVDSADGALPPPESPTPDPVPAAAPDPGAGASGIAEPSPVTESPASAEPVSEPPAASEPPATEPATTADPPTAAEPVPAAVPPGPLTYADVRAAAAAAGWPADLLDPVARVAWCESRYRPDAIGYGVTYGLMQLIPYWFEAVGLDFSVWADPVSNMRAALVAYQSDIDNGFPAWSAWTCKPDQVTVPQ